MACHRSSKLVIPVLLAARLSRPSPPRQGQAAWGRFALGYAVEQGHLPSNPVDRIQWTTPAVAASVDRRVVVSPAQARSLLPPSGR